jgi:hypothetical protein
MQRIYNEKAMIDRIEVRAKQAVKDGIATEVLHIESDNFARVIPRAVSVYSFNNPPIAVILDYDTSNRDNKANLIGREEDIGKLEVELGLK